MIFYNNKKLKEQIEVDYKELENYKNSYSKRISLYNTYLDTMQVFEDGIAERNNLNKEDMENKKQVFQTQINKIDNNLELLTNLLKNIDSTGNIGVEKKILNKYNQKYKEIRNNYIDETEDKEIHIKNNNTLLISEKQGKVILPYKAEEVLRILNKEKSKYSSVEEVIEDKFTRDFSDFKIQFASRYAETIRLARERENYSFIDAVTIATEMMRKKFLHPAIISACRTLNELDVYLDCLDKNELEDFKIFNVKYELYPMVVKSYNNGKRAKHNENPDLKIFSKIKKIFKMDNRETDKTYDK